MIILFSSKLLKRKTVLASNQSIMRRYYNPKLAIAPSYIMYGR